VPLLTDIRSPLRGSRLRELMLDGEFWRATCSEAVTRLGLEGGDVVDPSALLAALAQVEPQCARERALRLLTFKERSASGLADRLVQDGYPVDVAFPVVKGLVQSGLVDDDRFARSLARTLLQVRGFGRARALRDLDSAGIAPDVATAAVDDALPLDVEAEAAARLAAKAADRAGASVDKVAGFLLRRGYRPAVALAAARDALESAGHERMDGDDDAWGAADHDGTGP
jgi:regulatory protein